MALTVAISKTRVFILLAILLHTNKVRLLHENQTQNGQYDTDSNADITCAYFFSFCPGNIQGLLLLSSDGTSMFWPIR